MSKEIKTILEQAQEHSSFQLSRENMSADAKTMEATAFLENKKGKKRHYCTSGEMILVQHVGVQT